MPEADSAKKTAAGHHPLIAGFEPFDFWYWYDAEEDYIGYLAESYLDGDGLISIL